MPYLTGPKAYTVIYVLQLYEIPISDPAYKLHLPRRGKEVEKGKIGSCRFGKLRKLSNPGN
jgi:hypothetical protein